MSIQNVLKKQDLKQQFKKLDKEKQIEKIKQVKSIYDKLIIKVKNDLEKPKNQIKFLNDKLMIILNLLYEWDQYTTILNMPSDQAQNLLDFQKEEEQTEERFLELLDKMRKKHKNLQQAIEQNNNIEVYIDDFFQENLKETLSKFKHTNEDADSLHLNLEKYSEEFEKQYQQGKVDVYGNWIKNQDQQDYSKEEDQDYQDWVDTRAKLQLDTIESIQDVQYLIKNANKNLIDSKLENVEGPNQEQIKILKKQQEKQKEIELKLQKELEEEKIKQKNSLKVLELLQFKTIEDIEQSPELNDQKDPKFQNESFFTKQLQNHLDQLSVLESLSTREKLQIKKLKKIVEKIAMFPIKEGDLFYRVMTYNQ